MVIAFYIDNHVMMILKNVQMSFKIMSRNVYIAAYQVYRGGIKFITNLVKNLGETAGS